jgi:hypothetical protein
MMRITSYVKTFSMKYLINDQSMNLDRMFSVAVRN